MSITSTSKIMITESKHWKVHTQQKIRKNLSKCNIFSIKEWYRICKTTMMDRKQRMRLLLGPKLEYDPHSFIQTLRIGFLPASILCGNNNSLAKEKEKCMRFCEETKHRIFNYSFMFGVYTGKHPWFSTGDDSDLLAFSNHTRGDRWWTSRFCIALVARTWSGWLPRWCQELSRRSHDHPWKCHLPSNPPLH